MPAVTAAFWDDGGRLAAADPWATVLAHGARLVRFELMEDIGGALAEWWEDYEMTAEQAAFARSLFDRKMARPEAVVALTRVEVEWLKSTSEEPKQEGIAVCREKLAAVGILMP